MDLVHDKPDALPPTKSGEYYDNCPNGCCRDIDRSYKIGGRDTRGEEYLYASIYHAPECGANWSRATPQGLARDHSRGVNPHGLTADAAKSKTTFMMGSSPRYRNNYDKIDWSK